MAVTLKICCSDTSLVPPAGGTVILGPKVPQLDSLMQTGGVLAGAMTKDGKVGSGRILLVERLEDVPGALKAGLPGTVSRIAKSDARLDVVVHRDPAAPARRVVFICNPTADPIQAKVAIGGTLASASNVWGNRAIKVQDGGLAVELPAYTIEICDCKIQA